jgi:hypothetical protein
VQSKKGEKTNENAPLLLVTLHELNLAKSNNNQSIRSVDITSLDAPSLLLQHAALVLLRIALVHCHGRRTVIFSFLAARTDSLAAYIQIHSCVCMIW